ncbi:MAG: 2-succinyl-6-hydroxy-2,4-cyclohexadiene-carboxylate synthase, partial [Bacteroidota bacterium]
MNFQIKEEENFRFIDQGKHEETIVLLHGLFGALSNWEDVINRFSQNYRVIIPILPILEMPLREAGCVGLTDF